MNTTIDWTATPFFQQFGLQLDEMQEGYVRLSIPREAVRLRGARDAINGGLVAALGNVAMQVCLHTVMSDHERAGRTHELTVSFLDGARGEVTSIEARVLRKGGRLVVGEVELHDATSGALNAKLRVTCEVHRVTSP